MRTMRKIPKKTMHEDEPEEDQENIFKAFSMELPGLLIDPDDRELYLDDTVLDPSHFPGRSTEFCRTLRNLDKTDGDITIYISSYGGNLDSMLEVIDVIQACSNPVYLIAQGKAMSAGAIILLFGKKGRRFAYPNTSIMLHEMIYALGDNPRTANKATHEYMERCWERIIEKIAKHLRMKKSKVLELIPHGYDNYLMPEEALKLGLIDGIIGKNASRKA